MRKAVFITISILLTLIFSGYFFVYKLVVLQHKKEFKTYMLSQAGKIDIMEINPSELYADSKTIQWHDKNKEISKDGEMYDIVRIENKGLKVLVYAVADKAEKELKKEFERQAGGMFGSDNPAHKTNHLLKNFLSLKFIFQSTLLELDQNYSILAYMNTSEKTCEGFKTSFNPPPNI